MARRSKEIIRGLIRDSAIKLFTEKGYKEITMVEIAAEAKVAKRTLYKYYPSKIELFTNLFEQYQQKMIETAKNTDFQGLSHGETVKKIFLEIYRFTKENESFMRLFRMLNAESDEKGETPAELREQIQKWSAAFAAKMASLLTDKPASGLFAHYSPEMIIHMVSAINKGIYLQIAQESFSDRKEKPEGDLLLKLFCEMLLCCGNPSGYTANKLTVLD